MGVEAMRAGMGKLLRRVRGFRSGKGRAGEEDFRIPVLCYHSWRMVAGEYGENDHIALEADLRTLAARGYEVLPLPVLVEVLRGTLPTGLLAGRKLAGLSFDDGWDHDYLDLDDGQGRPVPGMNTILRDARRWIGLHGEGPMAVSFVIASPEARRILDASCGSGHGQWGDEWWAACAAEGVVGIANHGWDHVHETLPQVRQRENLKGSFLHVDTFEDAEGQIAEAQRYIGVRCAGRAMPLFGYPFGHVPPYLRDEYFPRNGDRLGIRGAFGTGACSVRRDSSVWDIPRFVCGWSWRSPEEFSGLLDAVERGER